MSTTKTSLSGYDYGNSANGFRYSITGGYVYRGNLYPSFIGNYFFSDFCTGEIGMVTCNGNNCFLTINTVNISESWVSFGEDNYGELYIIGQSGNIYKLTDPNLSINEESLNSFSLYPNPEKELVTLKFPSNFTESENITFINIQGQIIKKIVPNNPETLQINIETLSKGVYFVEINTFTKQKLIKKLVINKMNNTYGKLYLIPTTLGDTEPLNVLPLTVKKIIEQVDIYIVENEKTARRDIKKISPSKKQSNLTLYPLNKYTNESELPSYLEPCKQGLNIGLISEAGCPGIADPGAEIVKLAHQNNIKVVPLVGPSSILLALMGSGMNGQSFAFNGYLPIDKAEKKQEIKRLERLSFQQNQSQLFIETPYRNNKFLEDLCNTLNGNTDICVACDITLPTEYIKTMSVNDWKKNNVDLHKRPTLFIIHKS